MNESQRDGSEVFTEVIRKVEKKGNKDKLKQLISLNIFDPKTDAKITTTSQKYNNDNAPQFPN